jgi:2-oxoglutarate ferredoxin oxidoreductase subunit alpha
MTELPLVVVDVQRGGPSTGMPTKIEQADLLLALHGRNSESPVAVLAPSSPGDCFHITLEAFTLAVRYMTPVVVLSDGYLANSAEPWRIPDVDSLPREDVQLHTEAEGFEPYARDPDTLARPWAVPGTPGLEHRIGGLSKEDVSGDVSYDPQNNELMIRLRAEKIARIANDIPPLEVNGSDKGDLLVVGWGGTAGAIRTAVKEARAEGLNVSSIHLRHLNPFPADLGEVLSRFDKILVPELNLGQLACVLRAEFLVPAEPMNKVQGQPFQVSEILERIRTQLSEEG